MRSVRIQDHPKFQQTDTEIQLCIPILHDVILLSCNNLFPFCCVCVLFALADIHHDQSIFETIQQEMLLDFL